ncbi:Signal transduction histidine-protein kinase BaeS [compost metagenome]
MMKNSTGISRQLIITMAKVSLLTTGFSLVFGYLTYFIAIEFKLISVDQLNSEDWSLNIIDIIWILLVAFFGSITSVYLGLKLARRFISPLNALAVAAQEISLGNLSVRAELENQSVSEITKLIDDFNSMAEKLETSVNNASIWNAAIAHELRTPVTILQGRLQGVLDDVFVLDKALFKNLLNQVEQLSFLIEDLRTLSLADNQQLRLSLEWISLSDVIMQCINLLQDRFDQANLKIETDLSDEKCFFDRQRLEQILIALFENEIRYANTGILRITTKKNNEGLILTIEDEGPGIADNHIPFIFEPFYRLEESRAKKNGGSGLGLSVVNAIVTAHEGNIIYSKSKMLGGSCFSIVFNSSTWLY